MNKLFFAIAIILAATSLFFGLPTRLDKSQPQTHQNVTSEGSSSKDDSLKYIPIETEFWVDNYLSHTQKDTIKVLLWSNTQQKYLDSIPDISSMESTMEWMYWFIDNEVETVLFLKDLEVLRFPEASGLYYCGVLEEGDIRAIAIVPSLIITSDFVSCDIYSLETNSWKLINNFTTTPSLFYSDDEPELSEEWLILKDGRWMYRDYLNYIKDEDTTLHYVF